MSDITLRNVKGTPLTNQEVDDNFSNLNTDKYQAGDSPTFADITADSINITGGSSAADISAASIQITGGTGDQGTLTWNTEDETIDLVVSPDVTYQLGQELGFVAKNESGSALANGRVVRATGASGNKLTIDIADATTELGSAPTVGVVTETINNNSTGRVTTAGFVRGLDTSGFTEGVPIYLGTNGTFTATQPTSPSHLVHIGWVIRSHATEGSILVHVNNGWELEELHNVLITSVADNEILQWNASTSVWENRTLAEANIAELGTNVSFQNVTVGGDLTVSGTLTTINAQDLAIADNMIYLNDGSTNTNPDLGFAANYNDGSYKHAGLFRDADDGRWKFYDSYTLEPDAAIYIDTSHASFAYAPIQASVVYASSSNSDNWTTAYGWGNHATAGYQPANTALTTSTNFNGDVTGVYNNLVITGYNNTNWDTAYGWGDHSAAGYLTAVPDNYVLTAGDTMTGDLSINKAAATINMGYSTGPHGIQFYDADSTLKWGFYYRTTPDTITFELNGSSAKFTLDTSGNLTLAGTLSASGYNNTNWDTAYGWGNHATAGYLTSASLTGYATETYVNTAVSNLVDSAPATLDTLNELAAALGDDPNFATTVTNSIATKLPLSGGTLTGALQFNDANTRIQEGNSNALRIQTNSGWTDIGPQNTNWTHIQTDRAGFFTNKKLHVDGDIFVYGTQSQLTSSSVRAPIFYDTNNTSYYVDPAGYSVLSKMYLADQLLGGIGAKATSGITDWNDSSNARSGNGYTLLLGSHANGPGGSYYYHPFSFEYNSKDGSGNMTQFAFDYSGATGPFFRTRYSGAWTGWTRLWNSSNDGSGSGLDADLLDGQHGSYYAPVSSLGNYVLKTGDTMTGALTIQLNAESSRAPTALTLHSTMGDINGAGDTDGTFIEFKATDGNATFTPQVKIGMLVKDYTGDGGIPSEGTGNFVVYTAQGTDSGGSGTLTERFRVREDGPLYAGSDRVFADNYHPNADKWTTARTNTVTLTGDVTGSGSASVDGTGNWTVSLSTAVGNDSHSHSFDGLTGKTSGTGDYSTNGDLVAGRGSGSIALTINDGKGNSNVTFNHQNGVPDQNGNAARIEVNTDSTSGASMNFELKSNVTGGTSVDLTSILNLSESQVTSYKTLYENSNRVFTDAYHPNADTWTTARTNTVTLTGDVTGTGSASVNGSGNWTVSIAADWQGGTANTSVNMNNFNIENVNNLTFNDPGPGEGIEWKSGNGWKIYESPDDLATNSGGNLQFVTSSTRRATLDTSGSLWTSSQGTLWGSSNDGSGSGLDADLLDGQHGSYYNHRNYTDSTNYLGGHYVSGGSEKPNSSALGAGKLKPIMLSGSNLGFGGSWNDVLWMSTYNGSDVKGSWAIVGDKYSDNVYIARQNYDSASWGTGHKLWHSGNDGSGSGLDADLLDGQHGSYYAPATGGNYVAKSGDTMTGALTYTKLVGPDASSRDKIRVYSSSLYAIGMQSGITYGGLNDWAMTFQFNNDSDRGFWWGHDAHTTAQGAMSLTTAGHLYVGSRVDAPIFYDSDDTNYYVDPASTGTSAKLRQFVQIGDSSSYNTNSGSWGARLNVTDNIHAKIEVGQDANGMLSHWYAHTGQTSIKFGTSSAHDVELQRGGTTELTIYSGYALANNQMRAPIFYDSDNTNYYLNPANTSRLNNVTTDESYTYGWHRNYTSGKGLYNQATTQHFYSDDDDWWNVAGGSAANGIRFRDDHAGTVRGAVYADSSNNVGFLNNGLSWKARVVEGDYFLVEGSSVRAPIYYDSNNTNYYVDPASTSVLNGSIISNSGLATGGGAVRVVNPGGASFATSASTTTGAIKITLPTSWTSTMMRMTIKIYEYSGNESFEVSCGGYNYGPGYWVNTFAYIIGAPSLDRNFNVRFGHDGTNCCIYIGETNSTWSYIQVAVTDFQAGFSSYAATTWDDGWSVDFATSLGTISETRSACQVGRFADIVYDTDNTAYYLDAAGNSIFHEIRIDDLLRHNGDTDTYFQFHAENQARIVTGGSERFEVNNTYVMANNQFRTPIIYDLNDTAYYVDPNGTSKLNVVQLASATAELEVYDGATINVYSGTNYAYENYIYGDTSTNYMVIQSVLGNGLHVKNSVNSNGVWIRSNGTVEATGDITAYSDERLKENIKTLDGSKVLQMRGVSFTKDGKEGSGVIAQELEKVAPELVNNEGEFKSVAYGNIVGYLIEAIKEQQSQIEALQIEIKSLKEK